jgi:hypothetical protein
MLFSQLGGGMCSICKSPGTNKSTCPCNKDAVNKNYEKHPLWKNCSAQPSGPETTKAKSPPKPTTKSPPKPTTKSPPSKKSPPKPNAGPKQSRSKKLYEIPSIPDHILEHIHYLRAIRDPNFVKYMVNNEGKDTLVNNFMKYFYGYLDKNPMNENDIEKIKGFFVRDLKNRNWVHSAQDITENYINELFETHIQSRSHLNTIEEAIEAERYRIARDINKGTFGNDSPILSKFYKLFDVNISSSESNNTILYIYINGVRLANFITHNRLNYFK